MSYVQLDFVKPDVELGVVPRIRLDFNVHTSQQTAQQIGQWFDIFMVDGTMYLSNIQNLHVQRLGRVYNQNRGINRIYSSAGSSNNLSLYFDLSDVIINAIENNRKGDDVHLGVEIFLVGQSDVQLQMQSFSVSVMHERNSNHIRIPHNDWLKILQQIKFKSTVLFEIVTNFPSSQVSSEISSVIKNLENAQNQLNNYESRPCTASCRDALEGLDKAIKAFFESNNLQFSIEEQERISKAGNDEKESIRNKIRLEHIIHDKTKAEKIHDCKSKLRHICSSFGSHEGTQQEIYYHEGNSILQMTLAMVSLISEYFKK